MAGYAAVLILTYSVAQYADRRRDAVLGLLAMLAAIESYAFVVDEVNVGDEVANLAIPTSSGCSPGWPGSGWTVRSPRSGRRWPRGRPRARRSWRGSPPSRPSGAGSPARCTTSSGTASP